MALRRTPRRSEGSGPSHLGAGPNARRVADGGLQRGWKQNEQLGTGHRLEAAAEGQSDLGFPISDGLSGWQKLGLGLHLLGDSEALKQVSKIGSRSYRVSAPVSG